MSAADCDNDSNLPSTRQISVDSINRSHADAVDMAGCHPRRYFIAKVKNIASLKQCVQSSRWACRDRLMQPQPKIFLMQAFREGPVVIIFSVNNCHGWHGFAEMLSEPGQGIISTTNATKMDSGNNEVSMISQCSLGGCNKFTCGDVETVIGKTSIEKTILSTQIGTIKLELEKNKLKNNIDEKCEENFVWHYFEVAWKLHYLDFGEQCLPSKVTETYFLGDAATAPLNKCRNWQEINSKVGQELCDLMGRHYQELCNSKEEKMQKALESHSEPFYVTENLCSVDVTWKRIVAQVEKNLGNVILACPFGSQRYNLSVPESDTDMFIVYQARTSDMLGFHPPKQTIKNHEGQICDYTILEVYRYCELLLCGDARCVETLFLHDDTVVQASPEWLKLKEGRKLTLNRECLNKYLSDAHGNKGTKFIQKWCAENQQETAFPKKICKVLYVTVRLLQNARDIANGDDIQVFRETESEDRKVLMSLRAGNVSVSQSWDIINSLDANIMVNSKTVPDKCHELEDFLTKWLLALRVEDLKRHSESTSED